MGVIIQTIDPHSPAERFGVQPGERLLEINDHPVVDVLDYKFHGYDAIVTLLLQDAEGKERTVKLRKKEGEDIGLNFETYLMDKARSCANNCLFCFVDQLPEGMRESLYFKDDDARLSFLMGNYITLTNLSEREVQRIIDLHVSPINVSVHATDPVLRGKLLGFPNGGRGLEMMRRFAAAGITMNCQIVACPGLNDGDALQQSMEDLAALYPQVNSVSIVPVGLTKHREGLYPLVPYDVPSAAAVVDRVEAYAQQCMMKFDTGIFWCSDEFYIQAGKSIPSDDYYEDYTQLENGVGMLRLLRTEFESALKMADDGLTARPFSIASGVAATPWIRAMLEKAKEHCPTLDGRVYPIANDFFGHTVTVTGLITGGDLMAQLKDKDLGQRLILPINMLRHGEDVFLDDVTLAQVRETLNIEITTVDQDGFDLFDKIFEEGGDTNE